MEAPRRSDMGITSNASRLLRSLRRPLLSSKGQRAPIMLQVVQRVSQSFSGSIWNKEKLCPLTFAFMALSFHADLTSAEPFQIELDPRVRIEPVPQPNLESFIIEQLKCHQRPDVTRVFLALALQGSIDLKQTDGFDSVACYDVEDGFDIDGLPVHRICGVMLNDIDWLMFPDMYWRGPGTFPPEMLEVHTRAGEFEFSEFVSEHDLDVEVEVRDRETIGRCWAPIWEDLERNGHP